MEIKPPTEELNDYLKQSPIVVTGRVVRIQSRAQQFSYGIEFIKLNAASISRLKKALEYYTHPA